MLQFEFSLLEQWLGSVFWPFIRIGAMFMAAPVIGSRSVPVQIRIVLALLLAWLIAPMVSIPDIAPLSLAGFVITAEQIIIGLAMGFLLQLAFAAAVVAGQSIAVSMGLSFASVVDPENGVQVPVVSQFFVILSTLLFLGFDGHLMMVASLAQSFNALPVALVPLSPDMFVDLVTFAGDVFLMALLMALPVIISVLIVNISLGVITRAAPQLNIFAIGFPITIMVGMVVMLLSLKGFQTQSLKLFDLAFRLLNELVR